MSGDAFGWVKTSMTVLTRLGPPVTRTVPRRILGDVILIEEDAQPLMRPLATGNCSSAGSSAFSLSARLRLPMPATTPAPVPGGLDALAGRLEADWARLLLTLRDFGLDEAGRLLSAVLPPACDWILGHCHRCHRFWQGEVLQHGAFGGVACSLRLRSGVWRWGRMPPSCLGRIVYRPS